ncbi:PBP1A family penicillin-binding protein [bacterium]|nr:PBP1A family penicillin-binding protein [bacterium]
MKRNRREYTIRKEREISGPGLLTRRPWLKYPLFIIGGMTLLGIVSLVILSRDLPSLSELERAADPKMVTRIYSADGQILDEISIEKRVLIPIDRIPKYVLDATIALEDRKFYRHWGLDLRSIFKYTVLNIVNMDIIGGGSTLTQQLAKKVYHSSRQTLIRKIREGLTSLQIERTYSKTEILEMYLNRMEFGRGAFGIQSAAKAWFGKNIEEVTIDQAAMLVGMMQLPYGYYSPDRDSAAAVVRRNVVMGTMVDMGYLDHAAFDSLKTLPLEVIPKNSEEKKIAPFFCQYVIDELKEQFGAGLWTDGYSIYTTLDTRVQACADSAIKGFIPELEAKIHGEILEKRSFLKWLPDTLETEKQILAFLADSAAVDSLLTNRATLETSLTAIDPSNGYILAMVGGREWGDGPGQTKFNHATQAARQPGSCFKPLAYTVSVDNGYPPSSQFLNVPLTLELPNGDVWRPRNYQETSGGRITMREGLYRSLNLISIRMVQKHQTQRQIVEYAKNFGITTPIRPYASVVLGAEVVHPIEMVYAFATFANRGVRQKPIAVLRVEDNHGNVVLESHPGGPEVISPQTAFIMTDMLRSVLDEPRGTGHAARWKYNFYRPAAGKTGTTNDFRDAWFIGFTPQIASAVWVGFDDERIKLGEGQSGSQTGLPVWAPFMRMAHDTLELPLADFIEPPGIEHHRICKETGKLALDTCPDIQDEVFIEGTAPIDTCDVHANPWQSQRDTRRRVF